MAVLLGSIKISKPRGSVISLDKARQIAYSWHGGQWSPLYSFASSYQYGKRFAWTSAIAEIDDTILSDKNLDLRSKKELKDLKKFLEYMRWEENN